MSWYGFDRGSYMHLAKMVYYIFGQELQSKSLPLWKLQIEQTMMMEEED